MIRRYLIPLALVLFASTAVASTEGAWIIDLNAPELWAATDEEQYEQRGKESEAAIKAYEEARATLDKEQWEKAAQMFEEVARMKSRNADASQYWMAYAFHKLGRSPQALRAIEKLYAETDAKNRWRKDAQALELEIRQGLGQEITPEAQADEELKLIVIEGLMHTDSERAVPMLKKILDGNNSPKLKERALFVLGQSGTPEAHQIMADYARGASDPQMQMEAIQYLSLFGGEESGSLLKDIYNTTTDAEVKTKILEGYMLSADSDHLLQVARAEKSPQLRGKAIEVLGLMNEDSALWELYSIEQDVDVRGKIIESFMLSGDTASLLSIAKGDDDPQLRMKAIEQMGLVGGEEDLWTLYQTESDVAIRSKILEGLWLGGGSEKLIDVARTEKDPELRHAAIEKLGLTGGSEVEAALASLYATETDHDIRSQILNAFFLQGNVDGLIQVARTEKDRELRKEAIEKLSIMGDDKATDFLLELLDE